MNQVSMPVQRGSPEKRQNSQFPAINRAMLDTLQVNLGYRCNQACAHCHVDAGPNRTEEMALETIELILKVLATRDIRTLDLTGGAPELNPHFRYLVTAARALGVKVIDRCNLTILEEPGQAGLAVFLADNGVAVTASLPCYTAENVDFQRGKGVFEKSIRGLRELNQLGYARPESGLALELVYNPTGPSLPPPQLTLEETYRDELEINYGIKFTKLLTIANMPIARFRHALVRDKELDTYLALLVDAHSDSNLEQVMCRSTVSIDWRGYVYDCDFNQMLGLPLGARAGSTHLSALLDESLQDRPIATADHCFGCTAGQGSSCGGALHA
jgi:radical SAM/Cys-rich protein